jgi:malate dehydrogenase (oxaloacetate-decarboxylating)(NADP+)
MATGRSDYPNQINNVLGSRSFQGALDVRASRISEGMKMAAPSSFGIGEGTGAESVRKAYGARSSPFAATIRAEAVSISSSDRSGSSRGREGCMREGLARKPITDWEGYRKSLWTGWPITGIECQQTKMPPR